MPYQAEKSREQGQWRRGTLEQGGECEPSAPSSSKVEAKPSSRVRPGEPGTPWGREEQGQGLSSFHKVCPKVLARKERKGLQREAKGSCARASFLEWSTESDGRSCAWPCGARDLLFHALVSLGRMEERGRKT